MKNPELIIIALLACAITAFAGIGTVAVGPTTPVTVLSSAGLQNVNRWYVIQNPSTNTVYLKMDGTTNALTTTNGIALSAGGSVSVTATTTNPARNAVMALSQTGTTNTIIYQYGNEAQ